MNCRLFEKVENRCRWMKGRAGFYYRDLASSEEYGYREKEAFAAASIIKLPILAEAFRQFSLGILDGDGTVEVRDEDRVPSCGAMAYLRAGTKLCVRDICTWMIILSDNMAANVMAKLLGFDRINRTMESLGFSVTRMNRLFYDGEAAKAGRNNYFSPCEIGHLLQMIWEKDLISPKVSEEILRILKLQQINYKIPALIPETVEIAHKTGEADGITHDAGIIFARRPFILCFASCGTNVTEMEQLIREASFAVYQYQNSGAPGDEPGWGKKD